MVRKVTSQNYFMMLMILFGGMIMSQISMVGIFVYLLMMGEFVPEPDMGNAMMYIVPIVATIGFGVSLVVPARIIASAADKPTLREKLKGYQTGTIIKMALLEAPAVVACVALSATGQYYYLIVNAISLGLFVTAFPMKSKVSEALRLSGAELDLINDPNAVVIEEEITNAD